MNRESFVVYPAAQMINVNDRRFNIRRVSVGLNNVRRNFFPNVEATSVLKKERGINISDINFSMKFKLPEFPEMIDKDKRIATMEAVFPKSLTIDILAYAAQGAFFYNQKLICFYCGMNYIDYCCIPFEKHEIENKKCAWFTFMEKSSFIKMKSHSINELSSIIPNNKRSTFLEKENCKKKIYNLSQKYKIHLEVLYYAIIINKCSTIEEVYSKCIKNQYFTLKEEKIQKDESLFKKFKKKLKEKKKINTHKEKELTNRNEQSHDENILDMNCIACFSKQRTMVSFPCSHLVTCLECIIRSDKCTICRKPIESFTKIYIN